MDRFFLLQTPRTNWWVAGLLCVAGMGVQAQSLTERPASGLIIGFKDSGTASTKSQNAAPWASPTDRAQAQWARDSQDGRERVTRLAREAGLPMRSAGEAGNAQLLRFDQPLRGVALENAVRRARLHPDVAWVEPNVRVPLQQLAPVVPNDAQFGSQWHLQLADGLNRSSLNLPMAWGRATGLADQVIAVVDSGVRFDHPDLAGRLLPGYDLVSNLDMANDGDGRDADASDPGDFVTQAEAATPAFDACETGNSSWHGTFIAGQVAGASNNTMGITGLNWGAKVLPVRVAGKCGAELSDLLDGMRWAAGLPVTGMARNVNHQARVINLSFGGDAACSRAYQTTIDAVTRPSFFHRGALVVVAAGNRSGALTRPADCQGVMAVAAVRRDGAKAAYSSFGSQVALAAPGGSDESAANNLLLSTDNSGTRGPAIHTYGLKQGTSFSAPLAAGVASLMLAVNPALRPAQLIERMQAGARPWAGMAQGGVAACSATSNQVCNCTADTCGAGLLDADRALQLATGPAAVIEEVGTVPPGTRLDLDGSQSAAIPGSSIVSFQWSQMEGPAADMDSPDAATTSVTLAGSAARYRFRLTVVDDQNRSGTAVVDVSAATPADAGGGGGSWGALWGAGLWLWVLALAGSRRAAFVPHSGSIN